jgi:NAD(P)-dependent dehydrogenase (short-subunit alcohol dehydrogenase family)
MRAIITGAASGIGRATAFRLAQDSQNREGQGAQLMLVDLAAEKLAETATALKNMGARVQTFVGDLTDVSVPAKIVEATQAAFGGLDILVSNAGVIKRTSLLESSVADFDFCFAINTRATWLLAKAAHPLLAAAHGCIVATASISAHEPTVPLGAYSASKAALVMLMRQLACEFGPDGIRCNTVSPGSTHTAMTDARYSDPVQHAAAAQRNPLRMVGAPEDQAAAIAFLASPDAKYITGIDMVVDGGLRTMLMAASGMGDPWKK